MPRLHWSKRRALWTLMGLQKMLPTKPLKLVGPFTLWRHLRRRVMLLAATVIPVTHVNAQAGVASLDALLARADSLNPSILAARERVTAARARIGPESTLPDPMLMAGIQNLPLSRDATGMGDSRPGDPMTMRMLGISQTLPYPGKLRLRRQSAEYDARAAAAEMDATRLDVERTVRSQYFELYYLDKAIEIVERNRQVLSDVVQVTEAHYAAGTGGQQDVLKARVDAARLGETASELLERRRATVAELHAALDQPGDTTVPSASIPARIADAAVAHDVSQIRFSSQTLGARVADWPLPSLDELQDQAAKQSPALRATGARLQAQATRLALARKASLPDIDVGVQYGQRSYRPDMISAQVSVPLPLHRASRQRQEVAETSADLAAMENEKRAQINSVRLQVARIVSDLERERTELALYVKAILPQGSAAATAALASYQAGKAELLSVLDNQNTLFTYQTAYYRALADFAKSLAELEQVVGGEVLR